MTDFDSNLATALQTWVDDAVEPLDQVRAGFLLQSRLDRVEQVRRRRRRAAATVALAAAALIAVALLAGRAFLRADTVAPTGPAPSPTATDDLTLSADPFLAASDWDGHLVVQPTVQPSPLSPCLTNPQSWEAVQSRAMTYIDPNDATTTGNEYVLRFADAASAHATLLSAWHQMKDCPLPPNAIDDALARPAAGARNPAYPAAGTKYLYDEGFANQRTWFSNQHPNTPSAIYALRVARAGNIVVVIEDRGIVSDRAERMMAQAIQLAVQQYRGGCVDCVFP
jgi:hypothetical protein